MTKKWRQRACPDPYLLTWTKELGPNIVFDKDIYHNIVVAKMKFVKDLANEFFFFPLKKPIIENSIHSSF